MSSFIRNKNNVEKIRKPVRIRKAVRAFGGMIYPDYPKNWRLSNSQITKYFPTLFASFLEVVAVENHQ